MGKSIILLSLCYVPSESPISMAIENKFLRCREMRCNSSQALGRIDQIRINQDSDNQIPPCNSENLSDKPNRH